MFLERLPSSAETVEQVRTVCFFLVSAAIKNECVCVAGEDKLAEEEGLGGQKWTVDGSLVLCEKWPQR